MATDPILSLTPLRSYRSGSFRWLVAIGGSISAFPSTTGCQNIPEYGIGTPCREVSSCRSPLICANGHCALESSAVFASGGLPQSTEAGGRLNTPDGSLPTSSGGAPSNSRGEDVANPTESGAGGGSATPSQLSGATSSGSVGARERATEPAAGGTALASGGNTAALAGSGGSTASSGGSHVADGLAGSTGSEEPAGSNGHACVHDSECRSTHCVDGFCCDSECTDQCAACNLEEHRGQCTLQNSGQPLGKRTPCTNAGEICGGECHGEASCSYPDDSRSCNESSQCRTPFTRLDRMACDGLGYCATAITSDCAPQFCNVNTDGQCGTHTYAQVDVSESHTCAVTSSGIVECWGSNLDYGVLGLEAKKNYLTPTAVQFILGAKEVAAGWGHTCALLHDGEVECWGTNFNGDLGCPYPSTIVSATCSTFPAGSNVKSIVAGGEQTCALLNDGSMRCWGRGDFGQIGDGGTSHRFSPTPVKGITNAVNMTAGIWHTCATLADGTVKCWGNNADGELGVGTATSYPTPTAVVGIDGTGVRASAASAGIQNTCFLLDDSSIRCAGINDHGQLATSGSGSWVPLVASQLSAPPIQLTLGSGFACAIVSSRSVKCWGRGTYGTLGNGVFADSATPVDVWLPTGVEIRQISAKYNHVCALDTLGNIWCWGDNSFGQLGDGTQQSSSVPVIAGPP